jgi:hypothetical protein
MTALDDLLELAREAQYLDGETEAASETIRRADGELDELREVAGQLAGAAHKLMIYISDADSLGETDFERARDKFAEALAAWDALTNGGAK